MEFDSLPSFARWFLSQPFRALRPPRSLVYFYQTEGGIVISTVLCRHGQYQVELFAGPGPGFFPPHRHPNVDSIEVMLGGDVGFRVGERTVFSEAQLASTASDGASLVTGQRIRVRPTDQHGASVGEAGGAFLSIQRWLNDVEPTSVGLDWDGPAHLAIRGVA